MNLGQLIGELRMAMAEQEESRKHARRPGNAATLRRLLAENPGGLTNRALRLLSGFDSVTVGATLGKMPDVEKTGERGAFVFKLKETRSA